MRRSRPNWEDAERRRETANAIQRMNEEKAEIKRQQEESAKPKMLDMSIPGVPDRQQSNPWLDQSAELARQRDARLQRLPTPEFVARLQEITALDRNDATTYAILLNAVEDRPPKPGQPFAPPPGYGLLYPANFNPAPLVGEIIENPMTFEVAFPAKALTPEQRLEAMGRLERFWPIAEAKDLVRCRANQPVASAGRLGRSDGRAQLCGRRRSANPHCSRRAPLGRA
jgi:hypothetical protein